MVDVPPADGVYHFRPLLDAHPEAPPQVAVAPEDIALFQYTGGTTGIPKAAMLTHHNLVVNTIQVRNWMVTLEDGKERLMGAIPFFHVYGMTVSMCLAIYIAANLIILPNPRPIDNTMKAITKERATVFPGVPTMYIGIINHPDVGKYDLRSVKACISGAAPLPVQVLMEWSRKFTVPLIEGYGLSEASPVVSINPLGKPSKPGSIGLPIPNVEVSVQDDAGQILPPGQVGEISVRGGNVMVGYWNRPEETARTLRAGWLLTGDIGYQDREGYFYITDRKKDMLLVNGINVYPREIEEVIHQFIGVKEAAVIGVPDARKGEQPLAFVAPLEGATLDAKQLLKFLKVRLADYKVPRRIVVTEALPRNATGKILKTTLRQMAAGGGPV